MLMGNIMITIFLHICIYFFGLWYGKGNFILGQENIYYVVRFSLWLEYSIDINQNSKVLFHQMTLKVTVC